MDLKNAIKAHQNGNLELAKQLYQKCFSERLADPVLYQNYGALLKQSNNFEESEKVLNFGHKAFPEHISILVNRANLYIKSKRPTLALNDLLFCLRKIALLNDDKEKSLNIWVQTIRLLRELQQDVWAIELCREALAWLPDSPEIRVETLISLQVNANKKIDVEDKLKGLRNHYLEEELLKTTNEFQLEALLTQLSLNILQTKAENLEQLYYRTRDAAQSFLHKSGKESRGFIENYHISCWNLGCLLIKSQNFKLGWSLYDHGLRTPAEGAQKWQRAMNKYYSRNEVDIWKGETLHEKHLLIIEEQAIGDVMMFLTLIPKLANEAKKLTIMLSDRLLPIYKRSFEGLIKENKIKLLRLDRQELSNSLNYDYQIPLGSICQYRFCHPSKYAYQDAFIIANKDESKLMRQSYLNQNTSSRKVIGISWSGGGRKDRVALKSINSKLFVKNLMKIKDVTFVSLQYGNVTPIIERWGKYGFEVINDTSVDSLKNMDRWISQVDACDAVLSVSNTTIHGAGGLGKPTLCLLSQTSDWRWLSSEEVKRSYWYNSVGIARQTKDGGWEAAMEEAVRWIQGGCIPYNGPQWHDK